MMPAAYLVRSHPEVGDENSSLNSMLPEGGLDLNRGRESDGTLHAHEARASIIERMFFRIERILSYRSGTLTVKAAQAVHSNRGMFLLFGRSCKVLIPEYKWKMQRRNNSSSRENTAAIVGWQADQQGRSHPAGGHDSVDRTPMHYHPSSNTSRLNGCVVMAGPARYELP